MNKISLRTSFRKRNITLDWLLIFLLTFDMCLENSVYYLFPFQKSPLLGRKNHTPYHRGLDNGACSHFKLTYHFHGTTDWPRQHHEIRMHPELPGMSHYTMLKIIKTSWKSVVFTNKIGKNSRFLLPTSDMIWDTLSCVTCMSHLFQRSTCASTHMHIILNNFSTRAYWIWDDYSQLGATRLIG